MDQFTGSRSKSFICRSARKLMPNTRFLANQQPSKLEIRMSNQYVGSSSQETNYHANFFRRSLVAVKSPPTLKQAKSFCGQFWWTRLDKETTLFALCSSNASAIWPEIRFAAFFFGSSAKCAYRDVVLAFEWPRSAPIIWRVSPEAKPIDANEWRRS